MVGRTRRQGAGFEDARNDVVKTARTRDNDRRDYAGETTDTIREYLTAIGQHPLLEKSDEIRLGLAVERRMELKQRREEFTKENGFAPSTTDLVFEIYMALADSRDTLLTFAGVLGEDAPGYELSEDATISAALAIREVRDALDLPMDAATKSSLALALDVKDTDAVAKVAAISRLRWLLPLEVIEALDDGHGGWPVGRSDSTGRGLVEDDRRCGPGRG